MKKLILFILIFLSLAPGITMAETKDNPRTLSAGPGDGGGTYTACGRPIIDQRKSISKLKGYAQFTYLISRLAADFPILAVNLLKIEKLYVAYLECNDVLLKTDGGLPLKVDQPVTLWQGIIFVSAPKFNALNKPEVAILNEAVRRMCNDPTIKSTEWSGGFREALSKEERDSCTIRNGMAILELQEGSMSAQEFNKRLGWSFTGNLSTALVELQANLLDIVNDIKSINQEVIKYCSDENQPRQPKAEILHGIQEFRKKLNSLPYAHRLERPLKNAIASKIGWSWRLEYNNWDSYTFSDERCEKIVENSAAFEENFKNMNQALRPGILIRYINPEDKYQIDGEALINKFFYR